MNPALLVQDQDVLVDGDGVHVVFVGLSGVGTGTEAVAALGFPEGGGDPVLHGGRPEQTTATESKQDQVLPTDTESHR